MKFQYLKESNLTTGIKSFIVKYFLHKLKIWDVCSSTGVDFFIANSHYIQQRIKKCYRRESVVIYPNVEVGDYDLVVDKDDYYFTASRLVPYKKIDLIARAFTKMKDKKLIIIGDGPDYNKIKKCCGSNVEMLGYQDFKVLKRYMSKAKAFVFAAEEDFGIIPVEAQACGTPVIAYGKGGVLDTVIDGKTGCYFNEQTEQAIISSVEEFEQKSDTFNGLVIRKHAESFSTNIFKENMRSFMDQKIFEKLRSK